jgi:hypothetical protein
MIINMSEKDYIEKNYPKDERYDIDYQNAKKILKFDPHFDSKITLNLNVYFSSSDIIFNIIDYVRPDYNNFALRAINYNNKNYDYPEIKCISCLDSIDGKYVCVECGNYFCDKCIIKIEDDKFFNDKLKKIHKKNCLCHSCDENELQKFILYFPKKEWSWFYISMHPDITIDFIIENIHLPWEWTNVSCNFNITWEDIFSHPDLPWKYEFVVSNSNITLEIILENRQIFEDVFKNPEKYDQDFPASVMIFGNPNIGLEETYKLIEEKLIKKEDICWISLSTRVPLNIIEKYPDKPWNHRWMSHNPTLYKDYVINNLNKDWDWFEIGKRLKIYPSEIPETLKTNLSFLAGYQGNNYISWHNCCEYDEIYRKEKEKLNLKKSFYPNLWDISSKRDDITIGIIRANMSKGRTWNWDTISQKTFVTLKLLEAFPEYPWCDSGLSRNPNITLKYVIEHPEIEWDFDCMSNNRFRHWRSESKWDEHSDYS